MGLLPILIAVLFLVVLVLMSLWPPGRTSAPPARFEKEDEPGAPPAGARGSVLPWSLLGAFIGGAIGCVSAQMTLQGADFEHGAPGIGIYIIYLAVVRSALGALIGLFVGMFIGGLRAEATASEGDQTIPPRQS